jgi:hypothetical protein
MDPGLTLSPATDQPEHFLVRHSHGVKSRYVRGEIDLGVRLLTPRAWAGVSPCATNASTSDWVCRNCAVA